MNKGIIFFLIFSIQLLAFNQTELVNVYSSYSKVHGGTEDGGISGSERYVFLANRTVVLTNLKFDNKDITLTKKDSLVVIVETYEPYAQPMLGRIDSAKIKSPKAPKVEDYAKVTKQGNTYYVVVPYPNIWNGKLDYNFKGKKFTALKKLEFDNGYTGYAP